MITLKLCIRTQNTFHYIIPAAKQGNLACFSSGHPWGLMGKRFSLFTASRPLTTKNNKILPYYYM